MSKIKPVVIIIGAGPAGIAAAMQLERLGIEFLLFEQDLATGSLLKNAWSVENYLGVNPGISGIELLEKFQQILIKSNIKVINTKILALDYDLNTDLFIIKTSEKQYSAYRVIIATGTKPKKLDLLKNPDPDLKPYIFSEVFDLLRKQDKNIAIIGAGDAAVDNALNLAKSNQVHIFNYIKASPALPLLIQQALRHENISYYEDHKLIAINKNSSNNLMLELLHNNKIKTLKFDYLLIATGREAQKDFYSESLNLQEKKLLKLNRLFLIGDVKNNLYRQVAIATGDGILAAMQIGRLCH